jgi:spermidine/putrescine transport system ATP-binding protein
MIEARGVTKRFGTHLAVDGVSLQVRSGEFLTLLGPSGCGKTTLLRIFAGLEAPDAGSVYLGADDVTTLPPHRRDVNQVFQSYALFPHLSVRDNIAFGLRMRRVPAVERHRRVAEAIASVALQGMEDRMPHQLSGGQRQRVALARALVCRPKVLLLDEPLSALDAKLRLEMRQELRHLHRQLGLTLLFVTHDQQEALSMSDRVAVMNRGRIEQLGTPHEIYRSPQTVFAADFIGQANLLKAIVERGEGPSVRVRAGAGLVLQATPGSFGDASGPMLVSIRPERISVSPDPISTPNSFPARIEERVFLGPSDLLRIVTVDGTRLLALVASEAAESMAEGRSVFCRIRPGDIVPVAPGGAGTP